MQESSSTISFFSQGCRLNHSETALIERSFESKGFQIVDFKQAADVVVINTCTVTENGDSDAKKLVNKAVRLNPSTKIALVGCMAQIQKEKLLKWPNVNWVIGNAQKAQLATFIRESEQDSEPMVITPKMDKTPFTIEGSSRDKKHTRANLKIQDGCDFYCSFCIIPFARGPARSRVFDDILREATDLVDFGHKELVLTGINLGTYENEGKTLLDIVKALNDIDGLERIRISSIEPTTIPYDLIHYMAEDNKLCKYLHIPLQSGCDEMLTAMSRKYTMTEFDKFIQYAYENVPDICIGTDVIVGFPGESDDLFNKTLDYLRESPIHYFHVFSYSERQFARSKKLAEKVPTQEIARRSGLLRELSDRKRRVYMESFLNTTQKVLIEQEKRGFWTGVTEHYVRVNLKSEQLLKNDIIEVSLKSVESKGLVGALVG